MGDHVFTWDKVLPIAEFAYNSLINRSTRVSSFQHYTGYQLRRLADLAHLPIAYRASESAESF